MLCVRSASLTTVLALGCAPAPATQVLIEIVADDAVVAASDDLDVEVRSGATSTRELMRRFADLGPMYSRNLTLTPQVAGAERFFQVDIVATREDMPVVSSRLSGRFQSGVTQRFTVRLSGECIGVACPMGSTCVRGDCIDPSAPDAGIDTSARDAGPTIPDARFTPDVTFVADRADAWFLPDATSDGGVCAVVRTNISAASDDELWACGTANQLGACFIADTESCGSCACDAYTRSTEICDESGCAMGLGSGCSDGLFFNMSPWFCSGDRVRQSACLLRWLDAQGLCDGL